MTKARGLRTNRGAMACPPYTNGPYTWDQHVTFSQGISGVGINLKTDSQIWYVDSGKSSGVSGDGLSPETAFLTLLEAVTAAGNYDVIIIEENTIQTIATAGITITQTGLKIFGANTNNGSQNASLKKTVGATPMFIIAADRVEIAYLAISMRTAAAAIQIGTDAIAAAGAGVYNTYIHDCNFDAYSTATYAVRPHINGAYADAVNLVVENCYFDGFVTAAVLCNSTRETHRFNTIKVPAEGIGFDVIKTGGDRAYTVINDNLIYGVSGSATCGIKTAGNITAGLAIWARNLLAGSFNTTIGNSSGDHGVLNYQGSTTGGSLIDCNTSA
jgi:hypothetical protein